MRTQQHELEGTRQGTGTYLKGLQQDDWLPMQEWHLSIGRKRSADIIR